MQNSENAPVTEPAYAVPGTSESYSAYGAKLPQFVVIVVNTHGATVVEEGH